MTFNDNVARQAFLMSLFNQIDSGVQTSFNAAAYVLNRFVEPYDFSFLYDNIAIIELGRPCFGEINGHYQLTILDKDYMINSSDEHRYVHIVNRASEWICTMDTGVIGHRRGIWNFSEKRYKVGSIITQTSMIFDFNL